MMKIDVILESLGAKWYSNIRMIRGGIYEGASIIYVWGGGSFRGGDHWPGGTKIYFVRGDQKQGQGGQKLTVFEGGPGLFLNHTWQIFFPSKEFNTYFIACFREVSPSCVSSWIIMLRETVSYQSPGGGPRSRPHRGRKLWMLRK